MRVTNYFENDDTTVIQLSDKNEKLIFTCLGGLSNNEWNLYEYSHSNIDIDKIFKVVSTHSNEITFISRDFDRTIKLDNDKNVLQDNIIYSDVTFEFDAEIEEIMPFDEYIKKGNKFYNVDDTIMADLDKSMDAFIKFNNYNKKYGKVLKDSNKEKEIIFEEAKQKLINYIDSSLEDNKGMSR